MTLTPEQINRMRELEAAAKQLRAELGSVREGSSSVTVYPPHVRLVLNALAEQASELKFGEVFFSGLRQRLNLGDRPMSVKDVADAITAKLEQQEAELERLRVALDGYQTMASLQRTCAVCECVLMPNEAVPHCETCVPDEEDEFSWRGCMGTAEQMIAAAEQETP